MEEDVALRVTELEELVFTNLEQAYLEKEPALRQLLLASAMTMAVERRRLLRHLSVVGA